MELSETKQMRRQFSGLGWALLIYGVIMYASIFLCQWIHSIFWMQSGGGSADELYQQLLGDGWGYVLMTALGVLLLRLWKGKRFFCQEIWTPGAPMTAKDFFALLAVFMGCQLLFSTMAEFQEWLLNLFGLSAMDAMEAATEIPDTFSMFLYAGILAPITEELLFRGLILRTLLPYGKRFAILLSAALFGAFHGNIVQTPYAFCVGLVLAYTATEYSVAWAMVLHMTNNLVFADILPRLLGNLNELLSVVLQGYMILGFFIAAIAVLCTRRRETQTYVRANRVDNRAVRCFFRSPGILVALAVMLAEVLLSLFA